MIKVRLLHTATDEFIDRIVGHINTVYEEFEDGLWRPGAQRTTSAEISKLVMAGQLVIAEMDGEFAGCVRIQELSDRVGEFGMLAVDPRLHGQGVGRELVRFAEHHSKGNGITAMQLEVLMPRDWSHSIKDGLVAWYT